jgi:hypothetical protein
MSRLSATPIIGYVKFYCCGSPHEWRYNILLIGNIAELQLTQGPYSKRHKMLALTGSCDLQKNTCNGVFESTSLTISESMDGNWLEDLHVITMKNVVPVLWPLGTHLVLHGSHNDSKITLLQHSDESNCEFSTSIYYQAEGQRTIVRFFVSTYM